MPNLESVLMELTSRGELFEPLEEEGTLRCLACAHRCKIRAGKHGICQVRFNEGGELRVPSGYVAALQADPIEKKPFAHFLPGSTALTFGMLGCDFHCGYCQNWLTSQVLRDPAASVAANLIRRISPLELVKTALKVGAEVIVSSYNEPLITAEWSVEIFKEAKKAGLHCAYVSNGNATPEVLDYLSPYLSAYKVDLKSMQDKNYRSLGGVLKSVLSSIERIHELGIWLEVVTLLVPGFNDSPEELYQMASFIHSVSADIPWHVTAFHKDYKMTEPANTPSATLIQAADVGREAGLNFVYAGNLPGHVQDYENTHCPKCNKVVIRRVGYTLLAYRLTAQGSCSYCGTKIPGIWLETSIKTGNSNQSNTFSSEIHHPD